MLAIIKKELRSYFTSAPGYIFLIGFLFLNALFFVLNNITPMNASYMATLGGMTIVFLILIPILTMQLFADETKQRTDQLLYTSPLTVLQIVLGKYLGALSLFLFGMIISIVFPLSMTFFGNVPFNETVGGYIGFILLGACFISIGLFISCQTREPLVAAIGSFAALFVLYIIHFVALQMPTDRVSSAIFLGVLALILAFIIYDSTKNIYAPIIFMFLAIAAGIIVYFVNVHFYDAMIIRVLNWFSLFHRFNSFVTGIFSIADMVYYLAFSSVFIYLTINSVEKRRWK
ncbi:MAG: ABC transporter permease [Defluviitaleaceae bacterium]|nr:ABC transporter permease [Defluviitaleaceae bacterium]